MLERLRHRCLLGFRRGPDFGLPPGLVGSCISAPGSSRRTRSACLRPLGLVVWGMFLLSTSTRVLPSPSMPSAPTSIPTAAAEDARLSTPGPNKTPPTWGPMGASSRGDPPAAINGEASVEQPAPSSAASGSASPSASGQDSEGESPSSSALGFVSGRVLVNGSVPAPRGKDTSSETLVETYGCPHRQVDPPVRSREGGLGEAVVSIVNPPEGTSHLLGAPREVRIDQRRCAFVPRVVAARRGAVLTVMNSDPTLHSVHGWLNGKTLFSFVQPRGHGGSTINRVSLDEPGLITLTCDAGHTWMEAAIAVFSHDYFTVTDDDGRFTLPAIPAGRYELRVWHRTLGEANTFIDVTPSSRSRIQIRFHVEDDAGGASP